MNGDGRPELIVANLFGGNVSVLLNAQYRVTPAGSPATGTIHGAPAVGLNPGGLSFGDVVVGQPTAAQTVTLTNTGGADLILGALTLSGSAAGDYALGNDTCSSQTVAPAASCTFDIGFSPSATGARTGQVDIPSNASSSPDVVALAGNGVQGTLTMTPDPVDFGSQGVGTTSAAMSTTLQNTGHIALKPVALGYGDSLEALAGLVSRSAAGERVDTVWDGRLREGWVNSANEAPPQTDQRC